MKYTISKTFEFSAGHQLFGLPEGHQCARPHGHNYVVAVELAANRLTGPGFVQDYGDLAPVKNLIDAELDHRWLPDVLRANSTAENLARWLHGRTTDLLTTAPGVVVTGVGVSETPKTWAWYRP